MEKFSPAALIPGVKAPPPELRYRVHGSPDIRSFIAVGQQAAKEIYAIAGDHPITNVLDFGCGCGRVIAFLHERRKATYIGVDVDQDVVKWSQDNIAFASFVKGSENPPLPFSDGQFNFIYSVSVFTHLDEIHSQRWAVELSRILAPGGLLLITTHGKSLWPKLPESSGKGFLFGKTTRSVWFGANQCEWYGTTFMTVEYAAKLFHTLKLLRHIEKGIANHQDVLTFTKA
jgi:SAM-dependent methyltransferase